MSKAGHHAQAIVTPPLVGVDGFGAGLPRHSSDGMSASAFSEPNGNRWTVTDTTPTHGVYPCFSRLSRNTDQGAIPAGQDWMDAHRWKVGGVGRVELSHHGGWPWDRILRAQHFTGECRTGHSLGGQNLHGWNAPEQPSQRPCACSGLFDLGNQQALTQTFYSVRQLRLRSTSAR